MRYKTQVEAVNIRHFLNESPLLDGGHIGDGGPLKSHNEFCRIGQRRNNWYPQEDNMIVLITGASHTVKTILSQRLLEKYKYPYLSIDHLKMGLIRSGQTTLTPVSDDMALTDYLWPIVREMIKTAIENGQNLIVEGCYIPFEWEKDFEAEYLKEIKYYCLVMSEKYIANHFESIKKFASVIEERLEDEYCTPETVRRDNAQMLEQCLKYGAEYILIDEEYQVDIRL